MKFFFGIILLYCSFISYSQKTKIDTLSFDVSKSLLVIEGKINAIPIKFAFDTGAGLGVITKSLVEKAMIEGNSKTINVQDSNNQQSLSSIVTIPSISIGSFTFINHHALAYDMPFLKCGDYFLLGGDVINKLHWKFDFINKKVFISDTPFSVAPNSEDISFTIKENTHFADIYVNNKKIKNVLIDFGYNGFLELNKRDKVAKYLMNSTPKELMISGTATSMGALSTKKNENIFLKTQTISFDGNSKKLSNFYIDIEDTDTKIGLNFFLKACDELVINPFEKKLSLLYKSTTDNINLKQQIRLASILYEDQKLVVSSKLNIQDLNLDIGEEIESVNGRKASSFKDFCEYLDFMFTLKDQELEVIKANGEKVMLKKVLL